MPTTRPRYQVTETPELAEALDIAAEEWPGEPRSKLILKLVEAGKASVDAERAERLRRRREAVREMQGKFGDAYPPGYLEELRKDWPE